MSDIAAFHAVVHGHVQGVNFRFFVERNARALGLKGYVKNMRSGGEVEVYAEGDRLDAETLIDYLHSGPSRSTVDRVDIEWRAYSGDFRDFSIRF